MASPYNTYSLRFRGSEGIICAAPRSAGAAEHLESRHESSTQRSRLPRAEMKSRRRQKSAILDIEDSNAAATKKEKRVRSMRDVRNR